MYNILKSASPDSFQYFKTCLFNLQTCHIHNTRNNLLTPPHFNTNKSRQSQLYRSVTLWNQLPDNVKVCNSLSHFKYKCKGYLSQTKPGKRAARIVEEG